MLNIKSQKNGYRGFTLMEVLVGIAILLFLSVIAMSVFSNLRNTQSLNGSVEQIITVIEEARVKTLSSSKSLQYGVRFGSDKIVLFEGGVFIEGAINNQETLFPDSVEIYAVLLNEGGSDVIFRKLTGETDQFGTISVRSKKNQSVSKDIKIKSTGVIEI